MNKLIYDRASSEGRSPLPRPWVCAWPGDADASLGPWRMARRPMAGHEQHSTHLVMFLYCLFCTLLEQELWGKDWFLHENNTGEKGHLPLSAVSFFTYWLAPFKFALMSTLWVKANKSLRMTAFAQYLLCMHGQGFLGLQDQFCSLCPV